jgi:uncharacterized protein (DUF1501 family)
MDRRKFLKNAGTLVSMPIFLGGQTFEIWGATGNFNPAFPEGRILVMIQLDGGNDGLNMVIPTDQYSILSQLRPEVIIPQDKIIPLNTKTGLHPSFSEIAQLFRDQKIMIIQNVGYPVPNLSHFRSKEIILSASRSDQVLTTGWLGRFLTLSNPTYPDNYPNDAYPHPLAITIGNMSSPSFQGNIADMGVTIQNLTANYQAPGGTGAYPDTPYGYELKFIAEAMEKTGKYLLEVQKTGAQAQNLSSFYPSTGKNSLADQLKIVARLISGGLKTPLYMLSLGGFDTHASQVVTTAHETGTHAGQLKKVSEAVYAFLDDLQLNHAADKVIGLIFSEFGRRIRSNKSEGTDHGEAFPMLLFGNAINPVIQGDNPKLDVTLNTNANVPWKTDFRSVYRSILSDWFQSGTSDIQQLLQGDFEHIEILKKSVPVRNQLKTGRQNFLTVSPNPVDDQAVIRFYSSGGRSVVKIMSVTGMEIRIIAAGYFPEGNQQLKLTGNGLSPGQYFIVLENQSGRVSQKVIFK